jgi:uncharacterized membrane protein
MITVVKVVAILFAGLMTGLLFGDWLGPSFARSEMPLSGFVQFQQIIHYNYLKVLPGISLVALLASILWAVWVRRNAVEFRLLLIAVLAIAAASAITFIYNVPVNDVLETWNYNSPPSNARELWQPWESAHVIRTIFWVVGFVLEIVALALTARGIASSSSDFTTRPPNTR